MPRPVYDASSTEQTEENYEDKEAANEKDNVTEAPRQKASEDVSEEEQDTKPVKAGRLDKFRHKANHEATSEEDN